MPRCLNVMHPYGQVPAVTDIRHMTPPDTLVDMCPGDFLGSDSSTGVLKAALIQTDQAWDTNLATTQAAAKLKFQGVNLQEIDSDDGVCNDAPDCIPFALYREGSTFQRAYKIVDADGAAAPTTWTRGQGFTFGKVSGSNLLSNDTIQKTDTANLKIFQAVNDSGAESQAYALVEFES